MRSRNSSRKAWALMLLFAGCACAQTPAAPPAEEKPASLEGEVRNSITLAPLERAHVSIRRLGAGNATDRYGALTNAEGRFVIANVPAGNYALQMDRTAYVDLTAAPANQVRLAAGEKKEGLKLKLTPTGQITGRVLDADSAPMEGLQVSAESGDRMIRAAATDDRGMFRIGGLPPGKYRVLARLNNLPFPPEIRTDGTAETHYSSTYYPAALDPKNATRVEIKAGGDVTGVEIRPVRTSIVHISGKVSGMPSTTQGVSIQMQKIGGGSSNGMATKPDGSFETWRVDPGKYTINARYYSNGADTRSAPLQIEVAGSDIENLALTLIPSADVHGQVAFEDEEARRGPPAPPSRTAPGGQPGAPNAQPQKPPPRRVMLRDVNINNVADQADLAEDGTFTLTHVPPGRYRMSLQAGGRVYVKSMQLGQTSFDGDTLDLSNGAGGAPLTLRVASSAGTISGVVRDDKGPAAGARVALFEAMDRAIPMLITSKEDGSYVFSTVAPGKYRIMALDEGDTSLLRGPIVLEDVEEASDAIEVRTNEKLVKDLKRRL